MKKSIYRKRIQKSADTEYRTTGCRQWEPADKETSEYYDKKLVVACCYCGEFGAKLYIVHKTSDRAGDYDCYRCKMDCDLAYFCHRCRHRKSDI